MAPVRSAPWTLFRLIAVGRAPRVSKKSRKSRPAGVRIVSPARSSAWRITRERGGVAARDAVVLRADAHLDEPVRLRAHRAPHLAEPSVERARLRLVMELPVDGHVTPGVPRGS